MIKNEMIEQSLKNYYNSYPFDQKIKIWKEHSNRFKEIWENKILHGIADTSDYDDLVFIIDTRARNSTKNDEAVAMTFIRYPIWYKLFQDLNTKIDLRDLVNRILLSDDKEKTKLINELYEKNKNNKNGLTTQKAIVINSFLFLKSPDKYISSLSLSHRQNIANKFGLTLTGKTIGKKIVDSNNKIINYFDDLCNKIPISKMNNFIKNRFYSDFIYSQSMERILWDSEEKNNKDEEYDDYTAEDQSFFLEKYLENFIFTNWDNITELSNDYEIIVDDDNLPITLQYKTSVGIIDLLVKHKKENQYLVIELKRSKTSDKTMGQILRYMGWVKKNLVNGDES